MKGGHSLTGSRCTVVILRQVVRGGQIVVKTGYFISAIWFVILGSW